MSVQAKALPYIGLQSFSLVITVDGVVLPPTVGSGPTPLSQTLLQKCPATKIGMIVISGHFYIRTLSLSISLYHSLSLSLSLSFSHTHISLSLTHILSLSLTHTLSLALTLIYLPHAGTDPSAPQLSVDQSLWQMDTVDGWVVQDQLVIR